MPVLDLARDILEVTRSRSPITFVQRPQDDPEVRRPDTTLAQDLLGWEPRVDWRAGIHRTVDWFAGALSRPA
jgi:dTDP-glucose 4,6-dehydratase